MAFDLVVRNGLVVDGTGRAGFEADVAVEGEKIAAIGKNLAPGKKEIDAKGKAVAPGFIDPHTHMDLFLVLYPHGKDAFEKVPYVRDEGMKLVFERLFEHRRELERFAGCRLCDMRLLRELEGSGFVNRLYGSKQ